MNEQAVELLDHYLESSTIARGAILLTGPWGSGKTHFIKRYLEKRRLRLKPDVLLDPDHLYVTLYGVQSLGEIQSQFFAQTNPGLNSGPVRLLGVIAARALNTFTKGQAVKEADADKVRDWLARTLKGQILVFDDLERCGMPLTEVMGFINTFVEHEGAKVVLLACEAEIPEDQTEAYLARKEKLVSKTIELTADAAGVYDLFVAEMQVPEAAEAAASHRDAALRTFAASEKHNLRSLRSALHDFDRLVGSVDARLKDSDEAKRRILLFIIAATLELKSGAITEADIPAFGRASLFSILPGSAKTKAQERARVLSDIAAKYPEVQWLDSVVPASALAQILVRGTLDHAEFDLALAQHELVVGKAESPSWRRIWGWVQLSRSEYDEVRARFLKDLADHRIVEPGPLLHSIGSILFLKDNEDDLLDGEDPVAFFVRYLGELEAKDALVVPPAARDGIGRYSYAGLAFSSQDSEEFGLAADALDAAKTRVLNRAWSNRAPDLLAALLADDYSILTRPQSDSAGVGDIPILHHLAVGDFADLCVQDGRFNDDLIGDILRRYHLQGSRLKVEGAWLVAVRAELERRADLEVPPMRKRLRDTITYWFESIFVELGLPASPPVPSSTSAAGSGRSTTQ